jgi:DNA polymerase III subunit epsilon
MSSPGKNPFIADYLACFDNSWSDETDWSTVRFVVLDSETTGTDPHKDRLVSIGAVAVQAGEIIVEDSFEAMLKVAYNSSSVTVHGITREQAESGMDEPEALKALLGYLRDGVIVGHHIGFDITMLNTACRRHSDIDLKNRFLDTMDLTLHLEKDGAFTDREPIRGFSLDALCALFDVVPHDRHTAPGDAFITAQIFLRLLRIARRCGQTTLGAISERFHPEEGPAP